MKYARFYASLLFFALPLLLSAAAVEGERNSDVRVVPVEPTPESDSAAIHIVFPKEGEVKTTNPVTVQLRVEGFPIGYNSDFQRDKEIRNDNQGQTIHLFVDDRPYFEINEPIEDVTNSEEIDLDQLFITKLPFKLEDGLHILRVMPVRSFGESLKGDECFAASYFYMNKKSKAAPDLKRAYLTYNEPEGTFSIEKPILLDFYISNTQLSQDGYKVRLTIDGSDKRLLTNWTPYYIYGLKKGSHTIKLELLDPQGRVIPSLFEDTKRTITVK